MTAYQFYLDIAQRKNLNYVELASLCRDILEKDFVTPEIVSSNDFYGNAYQIKKFLGISATYPLKSIIQHGNQYGGHYWDQEISDILPVSLAWGEHIFKTWRSHTQKELFKIGAPFFYADSLLTRDDILAEKRRLGRNILVFPAHSMHHSTLKYDHDLWITKIREFVRDGFDSARICVYWKDYLTGNHKPYLEAGFECVSAGHMFDLNFLPRLRSLIDVSDATASNRIGSFLGYSIFLGKPHYYCDQRMMIDDDSVGCVQKEEEAWRADPGVQKIITEFSQVFDEITPEQISVLEPYFGFKEIKSKKELLEIVMHAENEYMLKLQRQQDTHKKKFFPNFYELLKRIRSRGVF